jgi:putative ABC transport system substrate-binding protein
MKRREFITLLGGAPLALSHAAYAQQKVPVIGFFSITSPDQKPDVAFRHGLAETGFIEGKNVAIEYRWAYGKTDTFSALAAELVGRQVNLIAAHGGSLAARTALAIARDIPIVFVMGDTDPVQAGIVRSLGKPGANITGFSLMGGALGVKRVGLLRDLLPKATSIAILGNPKNPASAPDRQEVEAAARGRDLHPIMVDASQPAEFEPAFARMAQQRADALIVTADVFFTIHRERLTALAAKYAIPAIYQWRSFAESGGLMTYGASLADANRQAGVYAGRILKGAKAADLPVLQPTKFDFVINLKTAKALGLTFPPGLLAIADEVIE